MTNDTLQLVFQKTGRKSDTQTVVETLYKNKRSLEAIFKILDKDNSGIRKSKLLKYLETLAGKLQYSVFQGS